LVDLATRAFDPGAGALGEAMRAHIQFGFQFGIAAQDDYRLVGIVDQAVLLEGLWGHFRAGLEALGQRLDAHFLILDPEDVGEAALERQTAHQRKLAAFKVRRFGPTGPGLLAFRTAPRRLALPGGDTTPNAARLLARTGIGLEFVQF